MKSIFYTTWKSAPLWLRLRSVVVVGCALWLAGPAYTQDQSGDRVSVPFRDPSQPGRVRARLAQGDFTVKGYSGKEVIVEARVQGKKESQEKQEKQETKDRQENRLKQLNREENRDRPEKRKKENDDPTQGLKEIEIAATGLTVEEENNVVTISNGGSRRPTELNIQVPRPTSLTLDCKGSGEIEVENVRGEIEVSTENGDVTLTHVSGTVIAHSLNGDITTVLDKVSANKPMSFISMNGIVDVTLPSDTKANIRLETQNGKIYSDFDVSVIKPRAQPGLEDNRKDGGKYRISFDKGISGSINGGGPVYQFRTLNGNIYVRKGTK